MAKQFIHLPFTQPLPNLSTEMREGKRFYLTPENSAYPSITTILSFLSKEAIDNWRERVGLDEADQISKHAAGRGTDLHSVIEQYLNNEEPSFPDNPKSHVRLMFRRMLRNLDKIDNIVAQEIPLYSDTLGVAGRCDCIGEYENILSVIDFKSSTKGKKKQWITGYFLQATAYSIMLEERTGMKAEQIVILICGENDFSCQVFVEKREKYIEELHSAIALFKEHHVF